MIVYCVDGNEHSSSWWVQNIFASRETVIVGMAALSGSWQCGVAAGVCGGRHTGVAWGNERIKS